MKRVIDLIQQKNHYLEKFYSLNESESVNFSQGDFSGLDSFYHSRDNILNVIRYIDSQLEDANAAIPAEAMATSEERRELREQLAIKDEYVSRILEQDLQILSCIETTKNSIIRELQEIKRSKKAIGSYKTPQHTSRLDEKA